MLEGVCVGFECYLSLSKVFFNGAFSEGVDRLLIYVVFLERVDRFGRIGSSLLSEQSYSVAIEKDLYMVIHFSGW